MINVNYKHWKRFQIAKLFRIKNTHSILRSKVIENSGPHPYVTAKEGGNSVESYISYNMEEIEEGNSILIGGKTLVISYQPYDYFSNDSHNLALYIKDSTKRTKNIQLFLVTALKASLSSLYSWGDSISKRTILKDYVYLPSKIDNEPDWEFMEAFTEKVEIKAKNSLDRFRCLIDCSDRNINLLSWKDFHLYDIFHIDSGNKFDKSKMDTSIEAVNFVGRSNFNNGITAKVNVVSGKVPFQQGLLTLALGGAYLGSCFVQDEPFYTSQNVVVLIPKEEMTWEAKQFISTAIFIESQNNYRAFIKELNAHLKKDFSFKLPVTNSGIPDYSYMTNFISDTREKVNNNFHALKSIVDA